MSSITIITPTYNRADLLPRLYESLLKQTITNETMFYGYASLEEAEEKHGKLS